MPVFIIARFSTKSGFSTSLIHLNHLEAFWSCCSWNHRMWAKPDSRSFQEFLIFSYRQVEPHLDFSNFQSFSIVSSSGHLEDSRKSEIPNYQMSLGALKGYSQTLLISATSLVPQNFSIIFPTYYFARSIIPMSSFFRSFREDIIVGYFLVQESKYWPNFRTIQAIPSVH